MDKNKAAFIGNLVLEQMIAYNKSVCVSDEKSAIDLLGTQIRNFSDYIPGIDFSESPSALQESFQKQLISIAAIALLIISSNKREFLLWNKVLDRTFDEIKQLTEQDSFLLLDIRQMFDWQVVKPFNAFKELKQYNGLFIEDVLFLIAARSIILSNYINLITNPVNTEVAQ